MADPRVEVLSPAFKLACIIVFVMVLIGVVLQVALTYFPPTAGADSTGAGQLHDVALFLIQGGGGALIGLIVGKAV